MRQLSLTLLVFTNLVPLYGVCQWQWDAFLLIYLFWLENLVIGVLNVARMILRPNSHRPELVMPLFTQSKKDGENRYRS